MSTEGTNQQQGFELYFEMERRARSLARWLTAGCLTVAVGSAAAFVWYGTDTITTAERGEVAAKQKYEGAQATILSLQDTIKKMQTDFGDGQEEEQVKDWQTDSRTINLQNDLTGYRNDNQRLKEENNALKENDTSEINRLLAECRKNLSAIEAKNRTLAAQLDECEQDRSRGSARIKELVGLIRSTMALEKVSATLQSSDLELYRQMLAVAGQRGGGRTTPGITSGGKATGVTTGGKTTGDN